MAAPHWASKHRPLLCSALIVILASIAIKTTVSVDQQRTGSLTTTVSNNAGRETYFEWNIGYALSNIQLFLGDLQPFIVLDWQKVYRQQAALNAVLWGSGQGGGANGTLRYAMQGELEGFTYRTDTNATATMNRALSATAVGRDPLVGTGMAPVICAPAKGAGLAKQRGTECNVLLAQAAVRVGLEPANPVDDSYGSAQLLDCGSQCGSFNDTFQLQVAAAGVHYPLSYNQLYTEQAARFTSVPIDAPSFIGEQINPLSLKNLQSTASLNAYTLFNQTGECSNTTSTIVPALPSYIIGGTPAVCARWNGIVIAIAWGGVLPVFDGMPQVECAELSGERYFGLVMYPQGQDTDGSQPFQFVYVFDRTGAGNSSQLKCAYSMKQTVFPQGQNGKWAQLYGLGATQQKLSSAGDSVCTVGGKYSSTPAEAKTNINGLSYTVEYLSPASVAAAAPSAYLHFSTESMSTLDNAHNFANNMKIVANSGSNDLCFLKQKLPTPNVAFDGDTSLADALLTDLLALAMQSAAASNQASAIADARAEIIAVVSQYTLVTALNTAMTSVAAGYGVNAFKTRLFCLAGNKTWETVVKVAVSLVEAALVNVATIAYLWGVARNRYKDATASWVQSAFNQAGDYESFTLVASTRMTLTGQVEYYTLQVLIAVGGTLISFGLVMYRWHFAKADAVDIRGVKSGRYGRVVEALEPKLP